MRRVSQLRIVRMITAEFRQRPSESKWGKSVCVCVCCVKNALGQTSPLLVLRGRARPRDSRRIIRVWGATDFARRLSRTPLSKPASAQLDEPEFAASIVVSLSPSSPTLLKPGVSTYMRFVLEPKCQLRRLVVEDLDWPISHPGIFRSVTSCMSMSAPNSSSSPPTSTASRENLAPARGAARSMFQRLWSQTAERSRFWRTGRSPRRAPVSKHREMHQFCPPARRPMCGRETASGGPGSRAPQSHWGCCTQRANLDSRTEPRGVRGPPCVYK
jgi:hypothetical protein